METAFLKRLGGFVRLSASDKQALAHAAQDRVRSVRAREDIIHEGDPPKDVNLILDGWACRYKTLEDGRRQIIDFLVPGDLCDLNVYLLREMDHSIGAITPLKVAEMSRATIDSINENHPRVAQAFWWHTLVSTAIQREWTVNIGQRSAIERVSHLFCELFLRLHAVGMTQGTRCAMPVTQTDLAEATGLTPVHVNRTLQELRSAGMIELRNRELKILDLPALKRISLFNANYLHLDHEGEQHDSREAATVEARPAWN